MDIVINDCVVFGWSRMGPNINWTTWAFLSIPDSSRGRGCGLKAATRRTEGFSSRADSRFPGELAMFLDGVCGSDAAVGVGSGAAMLRRARVRSRTRT
jgi:hypothetical protein